MEQTKNFNLLIAGRIQHGEKQVIGKKQKVIDYGYFIAKVKDGTLSFLKNRFNEKYPQSQMLHIKFFTENPLSIRNARYNQSGLVCYCDYNQSEGKQKIEGKWNPVECSTKCKYRITKEGKRPPCSYEGNLKFLLPDISQDRIWTMKITGYTSIFRLKEYIEFQKYIGNTIIGNYYLFLKKEIQTNKEGKTFENYILDIVKSDEINSKNLKKEVNISTISSKNVDNTAENSSKNGDNLIESEEKEDKNIVKTKLDKDNNSKEHEEDPFKNYFVLVESYEKELKKGGKLTKYQFATFVDQYDKTIEVVIAPQFIEEFSQCDVGTTVILDLKYTSKLIIANDIKFIQKCPKNVAA